jgi:GNAT superfamily N-acetyltransferase
VTPADIEMLGASVVTAAFGQPQLKVRPAGGDDAAFMRLMTYEAAFWRADGPRPDLALALADPQIGRYVDGWGRLGDVAMIGAVAGRPVGAAWMRRFVARDPGFGYVADDVPEVALAVAEAWRGQGVGTILLRELLAWAVEREMRVSLSVNYDNPAARVYRRLGFRAVHADADSWVMVRPPAPLG